MTLAVVIMAPSLLPGIKFLLVINALEVGGAMSIQILTVFICVVKRAGSIDRI